MNAYTVKWAVTLIALIFADAVLKEKSIFALIAEIIREDPDFGYRNFNNRDEDIAKLKWTVKRDKDGIEVRATDENNKSGVSEGFIVARPFEEAWKDDGIQITVSHLSKTGNWHNTAKG